MDTIFIWLIAGAAIGLLGVFLVASERELKRKRQELEELKHQLSDSPAPALSNVATDVFAQDSGAPDELIARNKDLLEEISSLSTKLETSESRLEQLETLRAHLNSKESEITELRWECERLQSQITVLKTPSASNVPAPDASMPNSEKDAEIAELKQQLEASRAKVRDLENTPVQLSDADSRQQAFEELQRSLEVSALQLQNALAAEQEKQKALEAIQMLLSDMQERHHQLSEANARLREENSQYQQNLTNQSQFPVERLVVLRQRLESLRSKQAEVSEQDRLIQEEIVSMNQLLDEVAEYRPQPSNAMAYSRLNILELTAQESADTADGDTERTSFGTRAAELHSLRNDSFDKTNGISAEPQHHNSANLTSTSAGTQATKQLSIQGLTKKRFGIFSAGIAALAVSGVLAAGFLGKDSEQNPSVTQTPPTVSTERTAKFDDIPNPPISSTATNAALEHKPVDQAMKPAPAITQRSPVDSRLAKTSEKDTTAIAASGKPSLTAWESYEIIRPTRVLSAPREDSQLVANVEPGTQVNVVDSRNGWLEIRSKHGRPPGFIPKASAIRIRQN
jgi:hypothetical protein